MLFVEPLFIFYAFPVFFIAYIIVRNIHFVRRILLLVGSLAFYCWGEPKFIIIVLCSTFADYLLAPRIFADRKNGRKAVWLTIGIAHNLAILSFYKYVDFLIHQLNYGLSPIFGLSLPLLNVGLPLGVSFIVFEKISYLVDVHRMVTPPARTWVDYSMFVMFFPKLLAGPIVKYHEIEAQIKRLPVVSASEILIGSERFALGLIKKLLIADPLGSFSDQAFSDSANLDMSRAWLGIACFTLQIYFDFSAYSDMAIGLARMLGFQLRENFDMPYLAKSFTEFWQRWHISLTTWIRDYLYIPLGGNRGSTARTYLNLWICFLLSGLWHGASWNFIIWGAYNGCILSMERLFVRHLSKVNSLLANATTLLLVMFGWVIFRTTSLANAGEYFGVLFDPWRDNRSDIFISAEVLVTSTIASVVCFLPAFPGYHKLRAVYVNNRMIRAVAGVAMMSLFLVACARMVASPFQPFLYFRF